jgi:transcriptional regulator with GAF, ATPase, and Fis domain
MLTKDQTISITIPNDISDQWQRIVDILSRIFNVPSALIMRVHQPTIEVFKSSKSENNPYFEGETANLEGLYCNKVMNLRDLMIVSNALNDPEWDHNPDIKLGMISYMGYPIIWPNGEIFGTICVLDKKPNNYNNLYKEILFEFKKIVESSLELIAYRFHTKKLNENIEYLEKYLSICAKCKKIKNESGDWVPIESMLRQKVGLTFTHGLCPICLKGYLDEFEK